jgi:hemerythrin
MKFQAKGRRKKGVNMLNWIKWLDSYSVDDAEMDKHHARIIEILNILNNSADTEGLVPIVIDELKEYLNYHFSAEEKIMKQYNYPDLQDHLIEHEGFVTQVKKISEYDAEDKLKANMIVNFLTHWLIQHILGSDKEAFTYINSEKKHGNKNN